ncbi:MAG: YkoF family thiamine/hydroxymethylpyrimidine-binding protein, partial [Microvirga sp.]
MFSGAQISLYPMTDDFVEVILGAIGALEPYRPNF